MRVVYKPSQTYPGPFQPFTVERGGGIVWAEEGTYTKWESVTASGSLNIVARRARESKSMRALYDVYIVDPEADTVVWSTVSVGVPIIARDRELAGVIAGRLADDAIERDLDDYDFVVIRLGDIRPKKGRNGD